MPLKHASRESIFEAASALHNNGQRPTSALIREALGVGSQTTIHKYLSEWKTIQQNKDNVHIKRANIKIHEYEAFNNELNERLNISLVELHNQSLIIEQLKLDNVTLQTSNNAYVIAFDNFQKEFTRKVTELESSFNNAIQLLSEQVSSVVTNSFGNVQEIGFAFQEKIITERLKIKELQDNIAMLQQSKAAVES